MLYFAFSNSENYNQVLFCNVAVFLLLMSRNYTWFPVKKETASMKLCCIQKCLVLFFSNSLSCSSASVCRDALNLLKKADAGLQAAPLSVSSPASPPPPSSAHVPPSAPGLGRPLHPAISVPGKPGAPVSALIWMVKPKMKYFYFWLCVWVCVCGGWVWVCVCDGCVWVCGCGGCVWWVFVSLCVLICSRNELHHGENLNFHKTLYLKLAIIKL